MMRLAWAVAVALLVTASAWADLVPLRAGQRIVCLGDSITQGGAWVEYVDLAFRTRYPDTPVEVIPLGLASETVCGLTEEGHPFPRPNVHDRLESALEKTRPDVVVFCYGMNDGNYKQLSPERVKAFQDGVLKLMRRIEAAGARPVILTPAAYDPAAKPDKLTDAGAWQAGTHFRHYDQVLQAYARWQMELLKTGYTVGDVNGRMTRFVEDVRRNGGTSFVLARDGIHPGPLGHWLMAEALLEAWNVRPRDPQAADNQPATLPMPRDKRWDQAADSPYLRYTLPAQHKPAGRYTVFEGAVALGDVTADEIAAGLDLTRFETLSINRHAQEMLTLVQKMHAILRPAWLSYVGHNRPGTRPGLPIEEARKQAAALDKQLRDLARPRNLAITIKPAAE